jgi:hypothetical protein
MFSSARPATAEPPRELSALDATPLPDGARALTLLQDDTRVVIFDTGHAAIVGADGRAVERLDVPDATHCGLVPWGARAFALCPNAPDATRAFFTPDSPRLARWNVAPESFITSRDGDSLTLRGPCPPEGSASGATRHTAADDSTVVGCTFATGRPWREWRANFPGDVVDVFDDRAILRRYVSASPTPDGPAVYDVGFYDIDAARWWPVTLTDVTARWIRVGFDRQGRLLGVACTGTSDSPRAWRVTASPGSPAQMEPLPFVVDDLDTLDARTTVAVTERGVFVSDDRWASLRTVHGAVTRAASARTLDRPARIATRVICQRRACVIDGGVLVTLDSSSRSGFP